jgi:hypothetical protein
MKNLAEQLRSYPARPEQRRGRPAKDGLRACHLSLPPIFHDANCLSSFFTEISEWVRSSFRGNGSVGIGGASHIRGILAIEQEHQIDLATALGREVPDVARPDETA